MKNQRTVPPIFEDDDREADAAETLEEADHDEE